MKPAPTLKQLKEIISDLPDAWPIPEIIFASDNNDDLVLDWNVPGKGFVNLFIGDGHGDGYISWVESRTTKGHKYTKVKLLELLTELYETNQSRT